GAGPLDHSREFVAEHRTGEDTGLVAGEVRAADPGRRDAQDDLAVGRDGVGDLEQVELPRSGKSHRAHVKTLSRAGARTRTWSGDGTIPSMTEATGGFFGPGSESRRVHG